jgi:hypothetical protein
MRGILVMAVVVGGVWVVDAYSLGGSIMQASMKEATVLYKRAELEIWKWRFYYNR